MGLHLLYIGFDQTYVDDLQQLLVDEKLDLVDFSLLKVEPTNHAETMNNILGQKKLDLILFDYTTINFDICSLMLFLRTLDFTRKIPFIGLVDKDTEINFLKKSVMAGVTFNYLKGEDNEDFLLNLNYVLTDQSFGLKRYATAKNQNLPMVACHQARIEGISHDELILHSDVMMSDNDDTEIVTHLFEDFKVKKFEIVSSSKNYIDHFFESYRLKIPYRGPWDDEKLVTLESDTMDTWLDLKRDDFISTQLRVLVFDGRDGVNPLSNFYENRSDLRFRFVKSLVGQLELVIALKPQIIIIEIDNTNNSLDEVAKLFELVTFQGGSNEKFQPAILLFNCSSNSAAFRKAYQYIGIITSHSSFQYTLLPNMIELYLKYPKHEDQLLHFSWFDELSFAEVNFPITVTSLSENQITFISKNQVPFFTNIKIELPQTIFVTILPPTHELPYHHNMNHYMGFIHGLSYEEKCDLRAFVNWLIFSPIEAVREEDRQEFFRKNKEAGQLIKNNDHEKSDLETPIDEAKDRKELAELRPSYKKGPSKF